MTAPVTVVIPAYNAAQFIPETLESVFSQTRRAAQVIVVNDGSPDTPELEEALRPWRDRIEYIKQENGGTSAAKNAGILRAQTPYIATIDSDDLWEPGYIDEELALLEREQADIVYCNAILFGGRNAGRLFMDLCPSEGEVTFSKLVSLKCHVNTSVLAKREIMLRAGLFDPAFRGSEDFDLWLRIAKSGAKYAYSRRALMRYRVRPGSLSSDQIWMTGNFLRVLEKCALTLPLTEEERLIVAQTMRNQNGNLELMLGKKALYERRFEKAAEHLEAARKDLGTVKLAAAARMVRLAPRLLLSIARCFGRSAAHGRDFA